MVVVIDDQDAAGAEPWQQNLEFNSSRLVPIRGQDPYPTPGHAVGLAFAVERGVRPLLGSLCNVRAEYEADLGLPRTTHGDLSAWVDEGVLLLNRALSVWHGEASSHRG